jgi:hypothetical protein
MANHGVPPKLRASLIEDVVFHVAVLVDEKTGSDFHESIFAALGRRAKELGEDPEPVDAVVAEVEVLFGKGRKAELVIARSGLERPALLRQVLEVAIGVRDVAELESRIDTRARFAEVLKKKGGLKSVRCKLVGPGRRSWRDVRLQRAKTGRAGPTLDGLLESLRAAVSA